MAERNDSYRVPYCISLHSVMYFTSFRNVFHFIPFWYFILTQSILYNSLLHESVDLFDKTTSFHSVYLFIYHSVMLSMSIFVPFCVFSCYSVQNWNDYQCRYSFRSVFFCAIPCRTGMMTVRVCFVCVPFWLYYENDL